MGVNFKEFKFYKGFKKQDYIIDDAREIFAEGLYGLPSGGMLAHSLCHKIWESDNEVDLTENEINLLKTLVDTGGNGMLIDGFYEQLNKQQ